MTRTMRAATAALVATAALAACSSTPTVDRDELASEISDRLEEQVGVAPDEVACPEDLTGEVGETMRCELTAGEDVLGVTVEVTGVDGDTVDFHLEVDEMETSP